MKRIQNFPYIIVPNQQFMQIVGLDLLKFKRNQIPLRPAVFFVDFLRNENLRLPNNLKCIPKHLKRTKNFSLYYCFQSTIFADLRPRFFEIQENWNTIWTLIFLQAPKHGHYYDIGERKLWPCLGMPWGSSGVGEG